VSGVSPTAKTLPGARLSSAGHFFRVREARGLKMRGWKISDVVISLLGKRRIMLRWAFRVMPKGFMPGGETGIRRH